MSIFQSIDLSKTDYSGVRKTIAGIVLLTLLIGCGSGGDELAVPVGWESSDSLWWKPRADTAIAFRDLETLESMGIEVPEAAAPAVAFGTETSRRRLAGSVKQSLVRIYRNEPEVVDSLFEAHVLPQVNQASLSGGRREAIGHFKREGYETILRHFRVPVPLTELGRDIQISFPDSLMERGVRGEVRSQVFLDEEGVPQAIRLLDGVHPVLNHNAMVATSEMRWRPAYLLRRGSWRAIPSWVRFKISFTPPAS